MVYEVDKLPQSIDIGYTGENDFRTVEIDMSPWVAKIPNGQPVLMHTRPGESVPYSVDITYADNIITWEVSSTDLGVFEGTGLLQVWFGVTGAKVGLSAVVTTIIHGSLALSGESAPSPTIRGLSVSIEMLAVGSEPVATVSIDSNGNTHLHFGIPYGTQSEGGGSGGGESGEVDGLTEDAKLALLQLASKVAYIDSGGASYYTDLYDAFYGDAPVPSSISAVFTPGSRTFEPGASVNELKPYLVVTVTYSDGTTAVVSNYTLTGSLAIGTNTITVNYGGQSTTFSVSIAAQVPSGYTQLVYINSGDGYADTGLVESEVARAEYQVSVSVVRYTKGNHILSATNTFFPYLSGSNANGDYSQIRAKLKGNETVGTGSSSYTWSTNTIYTLEGYVGEDNDVYLDGNKKFSLPAGNSVSNSSTYLLFATQVAPSDGGYRFHGRLYYMKIYSITGNLLRNYIPCTNGSNVAGLYDTVTQTFLSSATNDQFIAGPAV